MDHVLISFLLGAICFFSYNQYIDNESEVRAFVSKIFKFFSRLRVKYTLLNNLSRFDRNVFKPRSKR